MTIGSYSLYDESEASSVGLTYSFNGRYELGISYGSVSESSRKISNVGLIGNFLVMKQSENDPLNVELSPVFQRAFDDLNDTYSSLFTLGIGFSRDFSGRQDLNIIPRTKINYLVSPSVGVNNYLSIGFDVGLGLDLSTNFKLVVAPGVFHNVDENITSGIISGGIIFSGY